jgi:hypothetical protein
MLIYYFMVTCGLVFCHKDWLRSIPGGVLKLKMLNVVRLTDAGKRLSALHKYILVLLVTSFTYHLSLFIIILALRANLLN